MKARGTINQVKGDHTGNSVNVILLLFLDLILSIKAHFCVWVRNSSGLLFLAVVKESKASSKIEMQ